MVKLLAGFLLLIAPLAAADDLQTLHQRYVAGMLPESTSQRQSILDSAAEYARSQKPDGSWADVDYADQAATYWSAMRHLNRTLVVAKANAIKHDEKLVK